MIMFLATSCSMIVFPFLFTAFRIKFHSGRSVKDKVDFASAKSILRKCMLSEEEVRILFKCFVLSQRVSIYHEHTINYSQIWYPLWGRKKGGVHSVTVITCP